MASVTGTSPVHMEIVNSLTGISSSLSLLGSVCICYCYFKIPGYKNETKRMLLWLTLADALNALGNLIGTVRSAIKYKDTVDGTQYIGNGSCVDKTDLVCILQSFTTTYASMASFWWTVFIAFHHVLLQCRKQSCFNGPIGSKICHIVGWIFPLSITCFAVANNALGENFSVSSGPWCWIRRCNTQLMSPLQWMALTGKGWEISAYVITLTLYILMKRFMYKQQQRQRQRQQHNVQIRRGNPQPGTSLDRETKDFTMLWLFLYFYVTRVWGTIRFCMAAVAYNSGTRDGVIHDEGWNTFDSVLMYVQSLGDSAQAAVNCLVFCIWNKDVRQEVGRWIFKDQVHGEKKQLIKENQTPV